MVNNFKDIISHSMAFINDDYTELWIIVNRIYEENPSMSFEELIDASKIVIKDLLENHKVLLLDEETQKPAVLEIDEILKKVENRLRSLNRLPTIGDGIWFTI